RDPRAHGRRRRAGGERRRRLGSQSPGAARGEPGVVYGDHDRDVRQAQAVGDRGCGGGRELRARPARVADQVPHGRLAAQGAAGGTARAPHADRREVPGAPGAGGRSHVRGVRRGRLTGDPTPDRLRGLLLSREDVELVGALSPTGTFVTGYRIHPFVGVIRRGHAWTLQPDEVDEVLELSLRALVEGYANKRLLRRGVPIKTPTYTVGDNFVW